MNILSLVLVLLSTLRLHAFALIAAWRAARLVRRYRARAPRAWDCYATGAPVSPTQKGVTTIVWGTKPAGTQVFPVISTAIVSSLSITPVNAGAVSDVENGDGSCVESTFLDDGFNGRGEMVFDSALTYPANYTAITLTLPKAIDLSGGTAVATYPCIVESFSPVFTRKKEAMISFQFSHRPGRDGAGS